MSNPRWLILVPAVLLFIFSYNVVYEFSIKQLNVQLATIFNNYQALDRYPYIPYNDSYRFLSKVTFTSENVLTLSSLKLTNISFPDSIVISPLSNCPIDLSSDYSLSSLKSIQAYLVKFVNYDLKNKLAKLFFDRLTILNNLIDKANDFSIFVLHNNPNGLIFNSTLQYDIKTEENPKLIEHFLDYYNFQNNYGTIYRLIKFSNLLMFCLLFGYCFYIYISIANQYRIRSSVGLVIGWMYNVVTTAAASVNLVSKLHGYSSWKCLLEPTTTFSKLAYICFVMFISSQSLFKIIDHVTDKKGKLHMQLLSLFVNKWSLPLTFPESFCIVGSVLGFHTIAKFTLYHYIPSILPHYLTDRLKLAYQGLIIATIINFITQLTYLVGILIIDNTRVCLSDMLEKQQRENDLNNFEVDINDLNDTYKYDGANVISSYLLRPSWNIRPLNGIKYRLGHFLLKIRYESNPIFVATATVLLVLGIIVHWLLVVPFSLNHFIPPATIVQNSYSTLYYLEAFTILSFILVISFIIFQLTNSEQKGDQTKLELTDFEVEKKVFNSILLEKGHKLDIIKITSNPHTSFVISIGLDHNICVWSPLAKNSEPVNIATSCIPNTPVSRMKTIKPICSFSKATMTSKDINEVNEVDEGDFPEVINEDQSLSNTSEILSSRNSTTSISNKYISNDSSSPQSDINSVNHQLQLQETKEFWPINHINISDDGNYIILFNQKYGIVKCYERKQLKYIWECKLPEELISLINEKKFKILESFFRKKTVPGFLARKILQKKNLDKQHIRRDSNVSLSSMGSTINGNFPPPPPPVNYELKKQTSVDEELNKLQKEEFIIMLATGHGLVFSCVDGKIKHFNVLEAIYPDEPQHYKLLSAKKITTPRINDKIVFQVSNLDDLIVGTAVNNNWKFRLLSAREGYYNKQHIPIIQPANQMINNNEFSSVYKSEVERTKRMPAPRDSIRDSKVQINKPVLVTVEFVGMVVRVKNLVAELIDVQTGIILKSFIVGRFKPSTFKVTHSKPTHCKFCGCASIQSFSIVYEDFDTSTVILHTFKIDTPRSKNFICLRVERDPREIRCIGFNAANEHQYWYENIAGWELTDVNMIIGLKKPETSEIVEVSKSYTKPDFNQLIENSGLQSLRNRRTKSMWNSDLERAAKEPWKGFIITASDGTLTNYDLPDSSPINNRANAAMPKINCIEKYGYKSVIVNICNDLEIFYLGNDKLIEDDIYYSGNKADLWSILEDQARSPVQVNKTLNSELLFINKRRRTRERHLLV